MNHLHETFYQAYQKKHAWGCKLRLVHLATLARKGQQVSPAFDHAIIVGFQAGRNIWHRWR